MDCLEHVLILGSSLCKPLYALSFEKLLELGQLLLINLSWQSDIWLLLIQRQYFVHFSEEFFMWTVIIVEELHELANCSGFKEEFSDFRAKR